MSRRNLGAGIADRGVNNKNFDFVIVGAGIVGLSVARELGRRYREARIAVVDKERRIAAHQSSHNSGVIHAGIYYPPGSLKARLCVSGARELYQYCDERSLSYRRCGKVIVATHEGEVAGLRELERRGRENGVADLRWLSASELAEIEPHARGVAALHSPSTGVCDFAAVARALADDVAGQGGVIRLDTAILAVRGHGQGVSLVHRHGALATSYAVFCCGAWADRLAEAAGADPQPRIVAFRGAYLRLAPGRAHVVRSLIYPVPQPNLPFLGVHLTRTIGDDVLVGPTALIAAARDAYRLSRVSAQDVASTVLWPGTWKMARRFAKSAVTELMRAVSRRRFAAAASRYVPALHARDLVPGPVGVRGQAVGRDGKLVDDFVVSTTERALHVRNAPSPAATSALALARVISDRVEQELGLVRG